MRIMMAVLNGLTFENLNMFRILDFVLRIHGSSRSTIAIAH